LTVDAVVVIGTAGLVAVAILVGRWLDRKLHTEPDDDPAAAAATTAAGTTDQTHQPGESAATARPETGAARARLLASLRCKACGGDTTAGPALPVILDGKRLQAVTMFCAGCGAKRAIYFEQG
jgi:hypothetical protein